MAAAAPPPDWNTPADGDFVRYVEQLTARQAASLGVAAPHGHGRVGAALAAHGAHPGVPAAEASRHPGPSVLAPPAAEQATLPPQVDGLLRRGGVVLAWLLAAQAVALWGFGRGSWVVLLVLAFLWGLLHSVRAAAARLQSRSLSPGPARPEALQQRLRALAQQRQDGHHPP